LKIVFKIIFNFLAVIILILPLQAFCLDNLNCPKSRSSDLYINEAIELIVSGLQSNPRSVCLNQDQFKLFSISLSDISDKAILKPIILDKNFKYSVIKKELKKNGKLYVTFKIKNGVDSFTDKFSLYFNDKAPRRNFCSAFFDLPSKPFLKSSCQDTKK